MQQLQGAFPFVSPSPFNMVDLFTIGTNGITPGGAILAQIQAQPTIIRPWTIYGWSVQGFGLMSRQTSGVWWGRLGTIYSALLVGGSFAPQTHSGSFGPPFTPPQGNGQANIEKVWDGTVDPVFPTVDQLNLPSTLPVAGFVTASFQLPFPITMGAGQQLAVGLWLTPSVVNNANIMLYGFTYTVSYENQG